MRTFVVITTHPMKRFHITILALLYAFVAFSQINTDQVVRIGRNALYFEDYVLSIQYFNQAISSKPYLAQPYFFRALAKFSLDDNSGAEIDATTAIEHNPFLTEAYELRGVARQRMGKHQEAIVDYDKVLDVLPESRQVLFNKALAQAVVKKYDDAVATFEQLLRMYPRFDEGYIGRARLRLECADTTAALADVDRALEINKNAVNGYLLRADIAMNGKDRDYKAALADMDEAIRLDPKYPGYFINRAFLRHKLDDYFGAMSDYDYAIQLQPDNFVAHFNRAMLCSEVKDYDKALKDFEYVLRIHPDEYRTLYNRAIIYRDREEYKNAIADIDKVIEAFPTLAAAYFLRSDIKRAMGDRSAKSDYDRSLALAKERIKVRGQKGASDTSDLFATPTVGDEISSGHGDEESEPQDVVAARFSSLLTMNDNAQVESSYSDKNIRGRVQDRNMTIDIEPMFILSYYNSPTELKPHTDFMREIDEINRSRALRNALLITNHEPTLRDSESVSRHFESIDYYNSYIATHTPRAIDYFGLGMDRMSVHNFKGAKEDFDKAIKTAPDFTLAYMMRAMARYREMQMSQINREEQDKLSASKLLQAERAAILSDFDRVLELSPTLAVIHYNKGVLYLEAQDITSAINSFNRAIELKPDFGEAYYNRGYAYFRLGNRKAGADDLSKAGELGIVASYSVLKRMNSR